MKIIDGHDLQPQATITADICIVGAGAAGITIASALDGSPHSVCLIESGGYGPDEATQSLYDVINVGYPMREHFMSRARYFGGTCNLWAGRSMRLTQLDLERRDWVPDSGWPITYDELQRYYVKAEHILRLPSFDRVAREILPRRMSPAERAIFANDDLQPNISTWAKKPLRFGAAYEAQLRRSKNIAVYLHLSITDIRLNRAGTAVEELAACTLSGTQVKIRARRFVLACGGMENARLLLASRDVQPHGIGNQFDLVGRYFMDHPRVVFGKVKLHVPQKLPLMLGVPLAGGMAQVGIQFSEQAQRRQRLLDHYLTLERHWSPQTAKAYQSFIHTMKIVLRRGYSGKRFAFSSANLAKVPELIYLLAPRELMPHFLYRLSRFMRNTLGRGMRELIVVNYCEQAPNAQSRVYLSHERDRLHLPRLIVDWRVTAEETRCLVRLQELLDQHLKKHQLGYLDTASSDFSDLTYTDASHHIGTTRMSDDPRKGVVDRHGRVHGVQNLFIAGSSVFPTCGHANPTLTIVALAVRLAEHLKNTPG
ncbi:MAG TPA: GMC family oxidoreductase [Alphaproteobacteria bacterium]|nr:GMC family oxidoreductase [Alphaproteobacteria bacterium]